MPMHDWTKVPAGLFHDFHQTWTIHLKRALNGGLLPRSFSALVEQHAGSPIPDVLAIEDPEPRTEPRNPSRGTATLERPKTRYNYRSERGTYPGRANRVAVKHHLGRTVSIIEIVSPGNKDSRAAVRDFLTKTLGFLEAGIHVLLIDPFPPTKRDPLGFHGLIWDEIGSIDDWKLSGDTDRILASYEAATNTEAFIEVIGVGDALPDMPLFLPGGLNVMVPLEKTYGYSWEDCPERMKEAVTTGKLPDFQ
jgi:hypothetical protein